MIRLSMPSINKSMLRARHLRFWTCAAMFFLSAVRLPMAIAAVERDPVTMSVVAINPSEKETKVTIVRIELPGDIPPKDVLETGALALTYDHDKNTHFVCE